MSENYLSEEEAVKLRNEHRRVVNEYMDICAELSDKLATIRNDTIDQCKKKVNRLNFTIENMYIQTSQPYWEIVYDYLEQAEEAIESLRQTQEPSNG